LKTISPILQITREQRIKHRAELENSKGRMAFTLIEFWPCLTRETLFFQELAFVIHQGEIDVASMLQTNNSKLRRMKRMIQAFDMEVRTQSLATNMSIL
jgi:hypothetical protein